MGVNPSKQKGKKNPVERTQWTDAVRFCNKCSELEGLTPCYDLDTWECNFDANGYRLPTEAEWEYACRAGSTGEVLFRRRRGRAAAIRLVQAAFAGQAAAGRPEAAQPLGPVRHARQRLAMVQRLVRRDLLRGESGGGSARPGHGQDARAARRRLGLHRREVPVGLPAQGVPRLLRRLLRRRQLRLPAGAEGRWRRRTDRGRRQRRSPLRSRPTPEKQADEARARGQSGAGFGQDRPGQPQGHDRLRQRSRRHHENLEHARQRQGREAAHQGRRPRRRSALLARRQADPLHHAARRLSRRSG